MGHWLCVPAFPRVCFFLEAAQKSAALITDLPRKGRARKTTSVNCISMKSEILIFIIFMKIPIGSGAPIPRGNYAI
jgi:hypothetical protein